MRMERLVQAIAGVGLHGDCNANAASPRQVLLVSEEALRQNHLGDADLRANIVLDGDLGSLESGSILQFGEVKLRLTIPCEPCSKLERLRSGLSRSLGPNRGTLARVVSSGYLHVDERASSTRAVEMSLSPSWKTRAQQIVTEIPPGKVMTYTMLAMSAGVQTAYCRAFPRFLRSLSETGVPAHRVIPSDLGKLSSDQRLRLLDEGVDPRHTDDARWDARLFYQAQERFLLESAATEPRARARQARQKLNV